MSSAHFHEYKRARRRFRLLFYALCFAIYAGGTAAGGQPVTGWWWVGICAGAVLLEIFFWINVGLPRAVRKGSEEFKRAYYGTEWHP